MGLEKQTQLQSWAPHHVFQAVIYTTNAGIVENKEKGYRGRKSQAAIKVLESFQINSKLVPGETGRTYNSMQIVWVPGHMGIDGNEIGDQFARLCSSHPLLGPEPGLGTSAKVSREVFMNWKNRKHEGQWKSIHGRRQVFKKMSAKKARQLQYLSRNQLRIMTELQTGHCHLKGHPFKLVLIKSPE